MAASSKARGFVVVRQTAGEWEYLLLTSRKWGEPGFPKGHVDHGESELETASRETEEESGLVDVSPLGGFRCEIRYPVKRKGRVRDKQVVYFLAQVENAEVRLSHEHTEFGWYPLALARDRVPHDNVRGVLREAALFLKDPALFDLEPETEARADAWLARLPEAQAPLLGHLRGGARLAREVAEALAAAGRAVHVEAAAVGTLLHDTGRALGRHDDHQLAGLLHVRASPFAAHGFACISHFTKGASKEELLAAGLPEATWQEFEAEVDLRTLTWEERCAALADACMSKERAVDPADRFAELRRRYGPVPIIDLQEQRTKDICRTLAAAIGRDALELLDLA